MVPPRGNFFRAFSFWPARWQTEFHITESPGKMLLGSVVVLIVAVLAAAVTGHGVCSTQGVEVSRVRFLSMMPWT